MLMRSYPEKLFEDTYNNFKNGESVLIEDLENTIGYDRNFRLIPQYRIQIFQRIYFVDFYEPNYHIAVELDGYMYHEATRQQTLRDKKRERDLTKHNIKVFRFTATEVTDNPVECLKQVYEFYCSLCVEKPIERLD